MCLFFEEKFCLMCNGCGSVGRTVASDTRDPRFQSWNREILFSINCAGNAKIKRPRMSQFFCPKHCCSICFLLSFSLPKILTFLLLLLLLPKNGQKVSLSLFLSFLWKMDPVGSFKSPLCLDWVQTRRRLTFSIGTTYKLRKLRCVISCLTKILIS